MSERATKLLETERLRMVQKYGDKSVQVGSEEYKLDVVPSGSLTLDYQSGMGGFPMGHFVEVFGPPNIGKTSLFGFNAIRNVQATGGIAGIVAVEPDFDPVWAERNGVDLDRVIIGYPDTGEEAFEMLHDWVYSGAVDYIVFDSIGALTSQGEMESDGKARVGGQSLLISWGIKRVLQRAHKNNVGGMFINQIRDIQSATARGGVKSPGGWAMNHSMKMRIQVKPGKDRYSAKIDGEDVIIGQEIICVFKKARAHNALGKTAKFDYYYIETDDHPFGIDLASDVINVSKTSKVIEAKGAWLYHDAFPNGKLNGKAAVAKFFDESPKVLEQIRKEVIDAMHIKQAKAKK